MTPPDEIAALRAEVQRLGRELCQAPAGSNRRKRLGRELTQAAMRLEAAKTQRGMQHTPPRLAVSGQIA